MENASKALLIAGGILIGIAILTIVALMFGSGINFAKNYDDTRDVASTAQFNAQFETYVGRKDISMHEIVTVINKAKNHNDKMDRYLNTRCTN